MKRGTQGTVWSLPLVYALSRGIGGSAVFVLSSAGLFAAAGFLQARWQRIALRSVVYLGSLYIAASQSSRGMLWLLGKTYVLSRDLNLTALSTQESTLLFVALVPLLILAFELRGNVHLRLWQALGGVAVLAVLQRLDVAVAVEILLLVALYFPVRYYDLAGGSVAERPSVALSSLVFLLCAYALLAANAAIQPGASQGQGQATLATQGYLANPQQIDVAVRRSSAREFFAAVAQPVYWTTFVGEQYTGQGWRPFNSKWRTMQPLQLVGVAPQGEAVRTEQLQLYRPLPTDPVGGALVTVLSPLQPWRYRSTEQAYKVQGSRITVLAALPVPGKGIVGPGIAPPSAADLTVSSGLPMPVQVPQLAQQIISGVPDSPMAKAQAIIDYLRSHERYTLNVPSDQGRDFVYDFLFVHHAGDCNGFSSAFAVLARFDGIPTRWVSGFLPGQRVKGGYLVTAKDAHSWDEIYVAGSGWVTLDPTPGFSVPQTARPKVSESASSATADALRSARLAERQLAGTVGNGRGGAGGGLHAGAWAVGPVLLLAVLGAIVYVRRSLPLWWLRAVGRIFRDPWPRGETVRTWLRGRAPLLQAYIEWRTYRPQVPCTVPLTLARRDLSRLYLRRSERA
ncbi:MAG: transglutaminase-like domain-containing protein [Thermaerobacter sp.]|nr:transglutaminase-like domain-containing protein [Thermaerobacter sp.]